MERSEIRGPRDPDWRFPDCAALHPGYLSAAGFGADDVAEQFPRSPDHPELLHRNEAP
jgi:hypothetical protein